MPPVYQEAEPKKWGSESVGNAVRCPSEAGRSVALNPFGRQAFTGQEASRVVVRRGESLTLRYGVLVHESPAEEDVDLARLYRDFATDTTPTQRTE